MKLKVTHKILAGYVAGFILLLAFAALTLVNGKRIEATTIVLSQQKLPALITVAGLKSGLQAQTNHLYELYATNDVAAFEALRKQDMADASQRLEALSALPEFRQYQAVLGDMQASQAKLAERFVQVMRQPELDWDRARMVLSEFSQGADAMGSELDKLVQAVAQQTVERAAASQNMTEQLMSGGLVLTILVFLGVIIMAYFAHQKIARPLRATSKTLGEIATRRDLTSRLKTYADDEIGDIAVAANKLLEEFQRLALTLDGTAQEVSRTMTTLTEVTENTRAGMTERNTKLRGATQAFMRDIAKAAEPADAKREIDMDLHRAQMQFIQTHLLEIDEGAAVTERNTKALQSSTQRLHDLAGNMRTQIRLLNF